MKKIIMFLSIFSSLLLSEEKYSTVFIDLEYSGQTKVLIDCNFKNTGILYNYQKFTNDVTLNDTFKDYCKNGRDYKIDSLENFIKMYDKNTIGKSSSKIEPVKQHTLIKDGEIFDTNFMNKHLNHLTLFINTLNISSGVFSINTIPITFIENVTIKSQAFIGISPLQEKQINHYRLENLEFDLKTKSFKSLNLNEKVIFKSELYTNTYKIDNNKECVDGYIVNKKVNTNLYCNYILKPKKILKETKNKSKNKN